MTVRTIAVLIGILAAGLWYAFRAAAAEVPLRTVELVDLSRYAGTWYEIARYPNRFQRGCVGSMADYRLLEDGEVEVVNSCRDEEDGSLRRVTGRAWSVDPQGNARLKVSFFWPFRGDYWIMELGSDYEYAVVGTPNRKYFWILSRTPEMDEGLYAAILERAREQGFDPARVTRSPR